MTRLPNPDDMNDVREMAILLLTQALRRNPRLQAKVHLAVADLRVVLDDHGDAGLIALHLLGAQTGPFTNEMLEKDN